MQPGSFDALFKNNVLISFSLSSGWSAKLSRIRETDSHLTPEFNDLSSCVSYIKNSQYWDTAPTCQFVNKPHLDELMYNRPIDELEDMLALSLALGDKL